MRDLARIQHEKANEDKKEDGGGRSRRVLCVPNDRKTQRFESIRDTFIKLLPRESLLSLTRGSRPRHTQTDILFAPWEKLEKLRQKPQLCYSKLTSTIVLLHRGAQMRSAATLKVTEEHVAEPNREDLRDLRVCSVDPPGCCGHR